MSSALVLLVACVTQHPPQLAQATTLTVLYRYPMPENAAQLAHAFVSHDMKDPDSARFRDTFFVTTDARGDGRDKSKDSWCVEINGKNSYGAYVGYTWALLPAGGNSVIMGGNVIGNVAAQICSSAKYPPA
jgi:hypothetical protein